MANMPDVSPFAAVCERYLDAGLCVVPIAPGSKRPGEYSNGKWHGMPGWNRYMAQLPSAKEVEIWSTWPQAGIGLVTGKISQVVAVDVDTEDKFILRALADVMPPSPVRKRGRKGFTSFYRYCGEASLSWDINKERVLDLLSDGRQTVMPGTPHPAGGTYVYLTEDTLEDFDLCHLPELPKDFAARLDRVLGNMQTLDDKQARKQQKPPRDDGETVFESIAARYWGEINNQALARLDEWVPALIPGAKPETRGGYRCRAFWRNAQNFNVGIHTAGIRDFGGNYGMSPIDLVMYAQNVPFNQACETLKRCLRLGLDSPITLDVGHDAKTSEHDVKITPPSLTPAVPLIAARPKAPLERPHATVDPLAQAMQEKQQEQDKAQAQIDSVAIPAFITAAPGLLGVIADWINNTAPKPQPEFSVAAALAIGSTVMGRRYCTNYKNYPSFYYVLIGKTGEGKDYPQKSIRRILIEAGLANLIGGAGYTSQAGVMSQLMRQPSHITIIDEFGQMLNASTQRDNSTHLGLAMAELLKTWSSCDSQLSSMSYSSFGLKGDAKKEAESRMCYNPAITLFAATTPSQFYEVCGESQIDSGFMGRLILIQSNLPLRPNSFQPPQDVPDSVTKWLKDLVAESQAAGDLAGEMNPLIEAVPVKMTFSPEADAMMREFDRELTEKKRTLESDSEIALLARTNEKAMRLSMIVAKATNQRGDNIIRADAMAWAIAYTRHYDYITLREVVNKRPMPKIEQQITKALGFIRKAKNYADKNYKHVTALGAMPHSLLMQKMGLDSREFANVMHTAVEMGRITRLDGLPEANFGGTVYFERGQPD